MELNYRVLLYYQYVNIEDPEQFRKEHLDFCNRLGLKGSPTQVSRTFVPHHVVDNIIIDGTVEEKVKKLSQILLRSGAEEK